MPTISVPRSELFSRLGGGLSWFAVIRDMTLLSAGRVRGALFYLWH